MVPRGANETHRVSTPLELLVDLTFVVAVAQVAASLHHGLSEGHVAHSVVGFVSTFFAIWWAWMNFTWFASAYDTDDVPYRLATLVQMAGVLVLAAGVPRAFEHNDFAVITLGYVVMRVALVAQWARASRAPASRSVGRRYALAIVICQLGWVARLALPATAASAAFAVLVAAEVAVPIWAERGGRTAWHPGHIAERYGAFTIIVLGESILSATVAIQDGIDAGEGVVELVLIAIGGLLIVFSMWWIAFDRPEELTPGVGDGGASALQAFAWGYGHIVVFAAAAAVGAGITVAADDATGSVALGRQGVALSTAAPVALFLLAQWVLHMRKGPHIVRLAPLVAVIAVVGATRLPHAVLAIGCITASLVAAIVLVEGRAGARA